MAHPGSEITWHRLSDEERLAVRRAAGKVLARHSWVLAAWHHGSSALGDRPARDIDVAVVAKTIPEDLGITDGLADELSEAAGIDAIPFDVRIVSGSSPVNAPSPVFLGEMLHHGTRIYESDRAARIDWEATAMSIWLDFAPVWERMRRTALERWAHG